MCVTATSWSELLKFGGQVVIVGIGWVVVNKLAITRERDKARREVIAKSVDTICDTLDKLFDMARDYHAAAARDLKAEVKIKMALQDYAIRVASLEALNGNDAEYLECSNNVIHVRQAITGSHFEDEHTGEVNYSDPLFQNLAASTLDAKRNLTALKHNQFSLRKKFCKYCYFQQQA